MEYRPTTNTVIFMSLFLAGYLAILLRNTLRRSLDIYDFFMLSSLALVPGTAVFAPSLTSRLTHMVGVEFPLVIIFGALQFIAFLYLYRLVVKTNAQARVITSLTQEAGLLRHELDTLRKGAAEGRDK